MRNRDSYSNCHQRYEPKYLCRAGETAWPWSQTCQLSWFCRETPGFCYIFLASRQRPSKISRFFQDLIKKQKKGAIFFVHLLHQSIACCMLTSCIGYGLDTKFLDFTALLDIMARHAILVFYCLYSNLPASPHLNNIFF